VPDSRGGEVVDNPSPSKTAALGAVTVRINAVPGSKVRDVVKVAVIPLSASSADVTVDFVVRAEGGLAGKPRETLNLVVLEAFGSSGLLMWK